MGVALPSTTLAQTHIVDPNIQQRVEQFIYRPSLDELIIPRTPDAEKKTTKKKSSEPQRRDFRTQRPGR